MVCFVGVLVAAGTGCGYVAVGNERSANEGAGVKWIGEEVNHQYDKAFPWERAAHGYVRRHISAGEGDRLLASLLDRRHRFLTSSPDSWYSRVVVVSRLLAEVMLALYRLGLA